MAISIAVPESEAAKTMAVPGRRMAGRVLASVVTVACLALFSLGAFAQGASAGGPAQPAVSVRLAHFKVVPVANGGESLTAAESVRPGDVIEYQATYRNVSDKPVGSVAASLPVPAGLEYIAKTAQSSGFPVQVAASDRKFGPEPLVRRVRQANGVETEELVPHAEYRHLRWTLSSLAPGAAVVLKARARVTPLRTEEQKP